MPIPSVLTPTSVVAWVKDLPYANKPLVARECFDLIKALGESALPPRHTVRILEAIERPVAVVLEHIGTQLLTSHSNAEQFMQLGEAYCARIADIATALADSTDPRLRVLLPNRLPLRELELANHYLDRWLWLRALDHRPAPADLWRRVARINGTDWSNKSPALARLIAFQLANPASLSPRQIDQLQVLLGSWPLGKLAQIGPASPATRKEGYFLTAHGSGPEYGPVPTDAAHIDLTPLVRRLRRRTPANIEPALAQKLIQRWGAEFADRPTRTPTIRPLQTDAVLGLAGIVRYLRQQQPARFPANPAPDLFPATATSSAFTRRNQEVTAVSFIDISDRGCRIRIDWSEATTGDIIAVLWGRVEWRVGAIVWLVNKDGHRECGVQWLMKAPQPVLLRFDTGDPTEGLSGQCLAGGHQALVYRDGQSRTPDRCLMKASSAWEPYRLSVRETTGLVDLARIERTDDIPALAQTDPPGGPDQAPADADFRWSALSPFG